MKLNFQSITNSRAAVGLTLWIGKTLPLGAAYRLADWFAKKIARRDNSITRAVRSNQWVARGENSTPVELDQAVREVLCHAGRCFVDLYHNLTNPAGLKALFPLTESIRALIAHSQFDTPGAFIVAPHTSAFDLVLLTLAYHGMNGKVLTYGNPTGGYKLQNDLRAATGLEITPVRGHETEIEVIEYMRSGGIVLTAVDRPIRNKTHTLTFFGRPSPLPAGHIRMALAAEVPVIVVAPQFIPDGTYHLRLSEPIYIQPHADPAEALRLHAEAVLKVIEGYIRQTPDQWLMYYPVWPDVLLNGAG
ncbi:MAG: lysophospholipid acyltransferase family protein [Anaerolineales bacterium]|nr:lysophospholipid acyltransferase family protein [Anaerolineales bacterium]